jgi:hypothetical protein
MLFQGDTFFAPSSHGVALGCHVWAFQALFSMALTVVQMTQ